MSQTISLCRVGLRFGRKCLFKKFLGLSGALLTLILGSISGSIIGYSYIKLTGKDPADYELPFGTFLGAAALLAAIFGNQTLPM